MFASSSIEPDERKDHDTTRDSGSVCRPRKKSIVSDTRRWLVEARIKRTVHVLGVNGSDRRKREDDDDERCPADCDAVDNPAEGSAAKVERSRFELDLFGRRRGCASVEVTSSRGKGWRAYRDGPGKSFCRR